MNPLLDHHSSTGCNSGITRLSEVVKRLSLQRRTYHRLLYIDIKMSSLEVSSAIPSVGRYVLEINTLESGLLSHLKPIKEKWKGSKLKLVVPETTMDVSVLEYCLRAAQNRCKRTVPVLELKFRQNPASHMRNRSNKEMPGSYGFIQYLVRDGKEYPVGSLTFSKPDPTKQGANILIVSTLVPHTAQLEVPKKDWFSGVPEENITIARDEDAKDHEVFPLIFWKVVPDPNSNSELFINGRGEVRKSTSC